MRKIAVGIDLSIESERAAAHAVDLARHTGAEIVLIMVDVIPQTPTELPLGYHDVAERYARTLAERLAASRKGLSELRARWHGQGVELSQVVVDGFADEQVPKIAGELGADLIVVGSHGRTGLKRFLIGSVAERVVRLAGSSVLVARGEAPSGGYRRVTIGIDFSHLAEIALDRALEVSAPDARFDLVHCWEMPWMPPADGAVLAPPPGSLAADIDERLAEVAEVVRERLRARGAEEPEVHHQAVSGRASHGLTSLAVDRDADLIAVGSHGRRGVRRFVLGSVAEVTVRHAPCSVLVAR